MTTAGFGVDRTSSSSGTNSSDIRKIQGGLYSPGIISGCTVTTSPGSMSYTINAGVVAIAPTSGEIILAPVETTVISSGTASSRTDIIYVRQNYPTDPAPNNNSNIVVGVATSLPTRALEIARFNISSGQTNTNQAVRTGNINYSIPYGGSLGILHYWQNTYNGQLSIPLLREGHGTFDLPTDRRVRIIMRAVLSAANAGGFDNSKYCEYGWIFNVNGGDMVLHTTPGLHQAWATYQFESLFNLPAGRNTVHVAGTRIVGPGMAELHYGSDGDGYGRRGQEFIVEDLGPAV